MIKIKLLAPTLGLALLLAFTGCSSESSSTQTVRGEQSAVTITTTETTIAADTQVSAEDFTVPFYPGAKLVQGQKMTVQDQGPESFFANAELETADSLKDVGEFYQSKLPHQTTVDSSEGDTQTLMIMPQAPDENGLMTTVTISTEGSGPTRISLTVQTS